MKFPEKEILENIVRKWKEKNDTTLNNEQSRIMLVCHYGSHSESIFFNLFIFSFNQTRW